MRKHKPDLLIVLLTFILMAAGLSIIYAIGPSWAQFQNSATGANYSSNSHFIHQLASVAAAIAAFVLGYKLHFQWLLKLGKWLLIAGFVLSIIMAIMGAAGSAAVNCDPGACRWFRLPIGGIGFQPAELIKIGLLIYLPALISDRKSAGNLEKKEFWVPFLTALGLIVFFVAVLQKDLGSTAVMIFMALCMLIVSNIRWRYIAALIGAILLAVIPLVAFFPHRMERIMSFSGDADTHHIDNALIAIGTGGLFGVGVGNSVQATGYLPESINDSVFAVMGETFGFVGLMAILLVFAALLLRLLKVADRLNVVGANRGREVGSTSTSSRTAATAPREDGRAREGVATAPFSLSARLLVIGVFAWIAGHVIINIMGMTAIIPMKGITLPFLSYGGTSMAFIAFAMGLCLQLSSWTNREETNENSSSRWRQRRTHHAHHSRN